MTSREARTHRRAEERRTAKLEKKLLRSSGPPTAPRFNPELEDEFPREFQIQANALLDRIHRETGLAPIVSLRRENPALHSQAAAAETRSNGFVSQTTPQPSKRAETNRANSQHSTGPKSPEGKVASSSEN